MEHLSSFYDYALWRMKKRTNSRPKTKVNSFKEKERLGHAAIADEDKKAVRRVQKVVGHPQKAEFIRCVRAARVRSEGVRWSAKNIAAIFVKPKLSRKQQGRKKFQGPSSPTRSQASATQRSTRWTGEPSLGRLRESLAQNFRKS